MSRLTNFEDWFENGRNSTVERKILQLAQGEKYKVLWESDKSTFKDQIALLKDIKFCIECSNKSPNSKESRDYCKEEEQLESSATPTGAKTNKAAEPKPPITNILNTEEKQDTLAELPPPACKKHQSSYKEHSLPPALKLEALKINHQSKHEKLKELAVIEHALNHISLGNDHSSLRQIPKTISLDSLHNNHNLLTLMSRMM